MIKKPANHKSASWRSEGRIPRRAVLTVIATAPVWGSMSGKAAALQVSTTDISTIVDTFVPRDRTPSASDLRIHYRLLELASGISNYPELLDQGMVWINNISKRLHSGVFRDLSPKLRDEVLRLAFSQPAGTLPQVFVSRTRNDTMALYYVDQRARTGLGLDGPIQPGGYPDHDKPPEN